jgi:hypothetical protein
MHAERGFKRVELLVAGVLLVALGGVVVPVVTERRMEPADEAARDLHELADAISRFVADTHAYPTGHAGATTLHWLFTSGREPENNVFASGPSVHVHRFLAEAAMTDAGWSGPYVARDIGPDPWGQAYVVNVNGFFSDAEHALIVCAGPNGQINTSPTATIASGDDIAVVLK